MNRLLRAAAGLAIIVVAVVAVPTPAAAHTELLGTSPADAAALTTAIDEVTLTFSGPVRADGSSVVITGPGGQNYSAGPLSVLDFVVHQPVTSLTSGGYQIAWTVLAGDGHAMTGQFAFQVALPPELEPTLSPSSTAPSPSTATAGAASDDNDPPTVWWILAAVLAAGAAGAFGLLARRRSEDQPQG